MLRIAIPDGVLGTAADLARRCAEALLMSFKVQHVATVGGNLCLALPAGAMICAGPSGRVAAARCSGSSAWSAATTPSSWTVCAPGRKPFAVVALVAYTSFTMMYGLNVGLMFSLPRPMVTRRPCDGAGEECCLLFHSRHSSMTERTRQPGDPAPAPSDRRRTE